MKIQNSMVSAAIAAASWAPSSARSDKLNSIVPTQSPQPIANTLEFNYSEHDSMKNANTGAPFHLVEDNACDTYYSNEFHKISQACDDKLRSNWFSSEEYIDPEEHRDSRVNWVVAGSVFTIYCGCSALIGSAFSHTMREPYDIGAFFLIPTLMGIGLLTAGLMQMSRPEEALSEFKENMRADIPECIRADSILKKCIEISNETYGSPEHGHLRG